MNVHTNVLMSGVAAETLAIAPGLAVQATGGPVGTVVRGVDLADDVPPEIVFSLLLTFNHSGLMIVPGQERLTPDRQAQIARWFGPSFVRGRMEGKRDQLPMTESPFVQLLSNRDQRAAELKPLEDKSGAATQPLGIHSDVQDYDVPPDVTILHGAIVPPPSAGGNTHFGNLYMAYDDLSPEMKQRLDHAKWRPYSTYKTMRGVQQKQAMANPDVDQLSPVLHPVVRTHPVTGRKALWVSSFTEEVLGDWSREEGVALAKQLFDHVAQPEYWYTHVWSPHDVLFWDNRCVNHRRDTWDASYVREMHRAQAGGSLPF